MLRIRAADATLKWLPWDCGTQTLSLDLTARAAREIESHIAFWFFKGAAHERQGILITNEGESSTICTARVDRLNPIRTGIELNEIVIPHDVKNWPSGALEQVCQLAPFVPLCLLRRVESVKTSEEIAGQDNRLDLALPSDSQ